MVGVVIALVPSLGAAGMAYGMVAGAIATNGFAVVFAARREQAVLMDRARILGVLIATPIMLVAAGSMLDPRLAVLGMLLVLLGLSYSAWRYWKRLSG